MYCFKVLNILGLVQFRPRVFNTGVGREGVGREPSQLASGVSVAVGGAREVGALSVGVRGSRSRVSFQSSLCRREHL